jgi:hypothetical protein
VRRVDLVGDGEVCGVGASRGRQGGTDDGRNKHERTYSGAHAARRKSAKTVPAAVRSVEDSSGSGSAVHDPYLPPQNPMDSSATQGRGGGVD